MASELSGVRSPLSSRLHAWQSRLRTMPDQQLAQYILQGLQEGFHVGFDRWCPLTPSSRNLPLAYSHPEVITDYLQAEQAVGRMLGPLSATLSNGQAVQINRVGVVPKGHNTGRWQLITDLSYPPGRSVNDGIDPGLCSLEYMSVDRIAGIIVALGQGTLMAKIDIKSAHRLVPVHPDDRPLLACKWEGQVFVNSALPFGLKSAPKIFTAVADVIEWCFCEAGVRFVDHYLDDYIILGTPDTMECTRGLETVRAVARELGVPLAEDKCEGPTTKLTFLGIEIDTISGVLHLPHEKLERLNGTLAEWVDRRWCWRRDLESLVVLLHHASKVVPPGRAFLRHISNLLKGGWRHNHHIRLNRDFRADLRWWQLFLSYWNGVAFVRSQRPEVVVASDASGSWGCGAYSGVRWFQLEWSGGISEAAIAVKELISILLAVVTWGPAHRGARFFCYTDNPAVVTVVNTRQARDPHLLHLVRCLFFLEAHMQLQVVAMHIPGRENSMADDLSRNRLHSFFMQAPLMMPLPSPLPLMAMDLLSNPTMDWASESWIQLFKTIMP